MQKQAPTFPRIAVMVVFSLSCVLLLVYLWTAFGGPLPLKPRGYEARVVIPDAGQLAEQADVRISGVPVGKVVGKELDKAGGRTVVTLAIDAEYAPIPANTKVVLRQKTLLGETYVELSAGKPSGPKLPERGLLPSAQVDRAVGLDRILDVLDGPTREAFKTWQQQFGAAVARRGPDINATLANLPAFTGDATDLMTTLDTQSRAVRSLVGDTGRVFEALSRNGDRLQGLVTSADGVFSATAARQRELAQTVTILPTFLDELRATLRRTETFAAQADPLVRKLSTATPRLVPALDDFERMAPGLRAVVQRLDPLIAAARGGLPALGETLEGARPLLAAAGPFLSELNPILEWLEYNQRLTIGLFNAPVGLAYTVPPESPDSVGHVQRSLSPAGLESISLWPERLPTDRGRTYRSPLDHGGRRYAHELIQPSWDCNNTGKGEFTTQKHDTDDAPSCWTLGFPGWIDKPGVLPHFERADYSRPPR